MKKLIRFFTRSPVAANLLMAIMVLLGLLALAKLNTQFLPNMPINYATVTVRWPGANAEDVERGITIPLEDKLQGLTHLKKMKSKSSRGLSVITLEFTFNYDMDKAVDKIKQAVASVRHLPEEAETPEVQQIEKHETIAKLIITSTGSIDALRPLVQKFKRELLARGISKIEINGLPKQEIAIQIPIKTLVQLNMPLSDFGKQLANDSVDYPAGIIGRNAVSKEIRAINQKRSLLSFENLPIIYGDNQLLRLKDVATIKQRPRDDEVITSYNGQPAVEMVLYRTEKANTLKSAEILKSWLAQTKKTLPSSVEIKVFFKVWEVILERINLLLSNGFFGLVLILIILFLFLNVRIASWIAIGIPVSLLAAMAALLYFNGSINMISLFAFIMTLGIIVDDTIVVGEEALSQLASEKQSPLQAIEKAAFIMLPPILASSLTTVCAFIPLMLIGGVLGKILFDIPLVVICVIIASVIECFFVLPGHLYHSFKKTNELKPAPLNQWFIKTRDTKFKNLVTNAINRKKLTLFTTLGLFVLAIGLVITGVINFSFFPSPEGANIQAVAQFVAGTPDSKKIKFLNQLEKTLRITLNQFSKEHGNLLIAAIAKQNQAGFKTVRSSKNLISLTLELTSPDKREVSNQMFINAWRKNIRLPAGISSFTISKLRHGPPGKDIAIRFSGLSLSAIKSAANSLENTLRKTTGVSNIENNLPYGKEHVVFTLTPQGHALGLTIMDIGRQLNAAYNGYAAQIFYKGLDEMDVRVILPTDQRDDIHSLNYLPIKTPQGKTVFLSDVVNLHYQKGFDLIRHKNLEKTIKITADVDFSKTNNNKILANLSKTVLPQLAKQYGVKYSFGGRAEEQAETFQDMRYGLLLALALIYIVLAWVFESYGWPLLVMIAIPLGCTGAILGHFIMGVNLTILSIFGIFGLSGIVINDSIILINRYKTLREAGEPVHDAIVNSACQRLRPVFLTSITTIAGLCPLLFETSVQAQFLIPMAISICFGLLLATALILLVIPCLLAVYEDFLNKNLAF